QPLARFKKQSDFGLAKAIDRLHGIADGEDGAAVALEPTRRQALEQRVLRIGGVLELVDQQMRDRKVEAQQQIAWSVRLAQHVDRCASLRRAVRALRQGSLRHSAAATRIPREDVTEKAGAPATARFRSRQRGSLPPHGAATLPHGPPDASAIDRASTASRPAT